MATENYAAAMRALAEAEEGFSDGAARQAAIAQARATLALADAMNDVAGNLAEIWALLKAVSGR